MYPSFDSNSPTSIFYYKGEKTRGVYPIPTYNSAIMSIETQIEIKKFHKTSIKNNFTSNLLINFNNGIPTDEEKKILERKIEDKFTGSENAGKFLISWNEDKDKQTEILRLESDNFDEKYQALNQIVAKFTPHFVGKELPEKMIKGTAVIRIDILNCVGRYYK